MSSAACRASKHPQIPLEGVSVWSIASLGAAQEGEGQTTVSAGFLRQRCRFPPPSRGAGRLAFGALRTRGRAGGRGAAPGAHLGKSKALLISARVTNVSVQLMSVLCISDLYFVAFITVVSWS